MLGATAHHSVPVDARVNLSTACAFGLTRGLTDAFCFYPVDVVRLTNPTPFIPI